MANAFLGAQSGLAGKRTDLALKVKYIVPVASGKGGVGKSTVSVNLAMALAKRGARVGLMDADVYGPSVPILMGAETAPGRRDTKMIPPVRYGIKIISMGFFIPKGEAVIWRGPMLHKMVDDFLGSVDWGELDYLIVDLPPGTGDVQLSLCQKIPLTGAVIVSTPQDLAFSVAEKAITMFRKLRTPVIGLVENMSGFSCSKCGHHEEIFGKGASRKRALESGVPFLGEIPLLTDIRTASDSGDPIVHGSPESAGARAFIQVAENLAHHLEETAESSDHDASRPQPKEITQPSESEIEIRWADRHTSRYQGVDLRAACTCARCVDEVTGKRLVKKADIKQTVRAAAIDRVGRYGLGIRWSDGHSAGIYTFDYLRKLCPCAACAGTGGTQ